MAWGWLMQRFHEAITRPFRPADVDHAARMEQERRLREIEQRLDRLMELRFQANVEGRKPWEQRDDGRQPWSG